MTLVEMKNLRIAFPTPVGPREVVRGVSLSLGREKLAIVGESGSGKTLTSRAILRLLPRRAALHADVLSFNGTDILSADETALRGIRGKRAGLILQDPKYALNPVMSAGRQIAEAWRAHKGGGWREASEAAIELLSQMRLPDPARVAAAYPHELSGGMGQRVMIAMMLAPDPELLIADEPTSSLDVAARAEILRLVEELVSERGMALILISHDLSLVSHVCDRVMVMKDGEVVEELSTADLRNTRHPYTRRMLECVPSLLHPRRHLGARSPRSAGASHDQG